MNKKKHIYNLIKKIKEQLVRIPPIRLNKKRVILLMSGILLSPLMAGVAVTLIGSQKIADQASDLPNCQVAIIPGSRVYSDGGVSAIVYDRLVIAVELYKTGKVEKLLISGDHHCSNYDEVNTIRKWVLKYGVKPEDIFLDHAGFSTYETGFRAAQIFNIKSAIFVTQRYHLPRACYIGNKSGMDCYGLAADRRGYRGMKRYLAREWVARAKDWVYVNILKPNTVYDDSRYPIESDGRCSWD